ncbi:FAD:protein FMN transferase [Teredinibacter sp. KSP-S5-2]|uniref:FAD:protein FMN transferase n=1 Tax=Teredinibacter sp. KSP-S5-2 TaxID=3034506 RepID=UPI002934B0C8|nr:FAD:protein FMN transferase [Teredinibacter sp. KSP-S5-2]WNO07567.1 FAD:protein FMN transferase [Teredinibacter sp. KSP-S5-2]
MGTVYHITMVVNPNVTQAEQTMQMHIDKALEGINQIMSTYIPDSELSLLNQAPLSEWVVVSEPLFDVLKEAQTVSEKTQGAFDVTVGPMVNLWGFGPETPKGKLPSEQEIEERRARVGYHNIELNLETRQVKKLKDVYIDLSAIAKGYATDVIAELIEQNGFTDYMVEIGGELKLKGNSPRGQPWRIGVEKPSFSHSGSMQTIEISQGGMATSGDYRNYYEEAGVRVSHTINPATGRPITHKLASVTVIADSGSKADAYATALNVMGPEKAMAFAEMENMAVYLIIRSDAEGQTGELDFKVKYTDEFKRYMN